MCFEGSTVTPPPGPARNRPLTGQHSCRQPAKVIVVKHIFPQRSALEPLSDAFFIRELLLIDHCSEMVVDYKETFQSSI